MKEETQESCKIRNPLPFTEFRCTTFHKRIARGRFLKIPLQHKTQNLFLFLTFQFFLIIYPAAKSSSTILGPAATGMSPSPHQCPIRSSATTPTRIARFSIWDGLCFTYIGNDLSLVVVCLAWTIFLIWLFLHFLWNPSHCCGAMLSCQRDFRLET